MMEVGEVEDVSLRSVAFAMTVALMMTCTGMAYADVSGKAYVTDGDTVKIGDSRIRLHGIDSPESAQTCMVDDSPWPCGRRATDALIEKVKGSEINCIEKNKDRYGRIVAVCWRDDVDLNSWMVAEGWALAYRQFSDDYVEEELAAQAGLKGIWRGRFVAPWEWRRGKRFVITSETITEQKTEDGECRIKGNIGRNGTRIYHVPGGSFYDRTRIDTSLGERWFCSEDEARDAGWRKSSR